MTTKEPGGSELGKEIRHLLELDINPLSELLLFAADRAEHIQKTIKPALERDYIVLSDRFTLSTEIYQGWARHCTSTARIAFLNEMVTGGLTPNLTLIIDVNPETALQRVKDRGKLARIEREGLEFYKKVREGYLRKANAKPSQFAIVNGNQSIEAIAQEIQIVLMFYFPLMLNDFQWP